MRCGICGRPIRAGEHVDEFRGDVYHEETDVCVRRLTNFYMAIIFCQGLLTGGVFLGLLLRAAR
jgi:hypothetical protein